ncbi:MAG TPA: (deoxy)nucleoside triphosphate pyrophosphohydrolase [Microbacteriaceae bacterium]
MIAAEPLRVVAAVIVHEGCVLACWRNPDRSAGGKWEFPGGKVEHGESPEDALAREIQEELSVDIEVGDLIHRATTSTGSAYVDLSSYEAHVTGTMPTRSTDHDMLRWLPVDQLSKLSWAAPDQPVVELLEGFDSAL